MSHGSKLWAIMVDFKRKISHCSYVKTVRETLLCNPLEPSVGHLSFFLKKNDLEDFKGQLKR